VAETTTAYPPESVSSANPADDRREALKPLDGRARELALVPAETRRPARQSLFEGKGWMRLRLVTDLVALLLGNAAALVGASAAGADESGEFLVWLFPPLAIAALAARGMYGSRLHIRVADGIGSLVAATSLAAITLIAAAALLEPSEHVAPLLARAWLFGTVYLVGARLVLALAQRRARSGRLVAKRTLIVGAGEIGARVERRLMEQPELGLLPVGYLDADPAPEEMVPDRTVPVLGDPADLGWIARTTGAQHVVLGFSSAPDRSLIPLVQECEDLGLEVSLVPRLFESVNVRVRMEHVGGLPLFGLRSIDPRGWQFAAKHLFDRAAAALLLVVLAPLLGAVALMVRATSPGPVFFRQKRIGRDGHSFEMLKFRSMRTDERSGKDENVLFLPTDLGPGGVEGADRRTAFGTYLRRTSIDELPQLINVLKGDMSLVGPRPERPEFVELFGSRIYRYDDRHRVKSGITGWAQVNGLRGKTSLRDRVEWDNYYIENWSLGLDLKILLMTLAAPFSARAE
jgi:exopolysaccharide biosynthesis polyprenyl glycosylphosphotransferase